LLLSSHANQLELVLHLLPPSLRADGFASLETGLQSLDDGGHAIDTPPHRAGSSATPAVLVVLHYFRPSCFFASPPGGATLAAAVVAVDVKAWPLGAPSSVSA